MSADAALIHSLGAAIEDTLAPLIPQGSRVALLQFPHHANVGDSAIWLGEALFLASRDAKVVYTSDQYLFDEDMLRRRIGDGIIAFHGGGNFGDLYPIYQDFRERVVSRFPRNRIVQFPQTVHFSDPVHVERTRGAFGESEGLTVIARDQESLNLLRQHFDFNSVMSPDMSFCIGPLTRLGHECDVLWLARRDQESGHPNDAIGADRLQVADWFRGSESLGELEWRLRDHLLVQGHWQMTRIGRRFPSTRGILWRVLGPGYDRIAARRVERGRRILSRGEVVICDRLHAHILCMLMGIPHVILGDRYGKIDNFRRAWTSGSVLAESAETTEDAARKATRLVGRVQ